MPRIAAGSAKRDLLICITSIDQEKKNSRWKVVPTFFLDKNLVHFGNIAELVGGTWFCGGSSRVGSAINTGLVKIFTGIPGFLCISPGLPGISSGTTGHLRMTFSRRVWYPNGTRDLAAIQAAYDCCQCR